MATKRCALFIGALLLLSVCALAGSTAVTARAQLHIPVLMGLTLQQGPVVQQGKAVCALIQAPHPTAEDWERGFLEIRGVVARTVRSNADWVVLVRVVGGPGGESTCSGLQVRTPDGVYHLLGSAGLPVARGLPGKHELALDYRLSLAASGSFTVEFVVLED